MTQIELNEKDCELFLLFREYQDTFQLLVNQGVFKTRNGQVTIDFDNDGIASVKLLSRLYRKT